MPNGHFQRVSGFFKSNKKDYLNLLETVILPLGETYFEPIGTPYWFTDHGPNHSKRVLDFALDIAVRLPQRLTSLEAFTLAACCYLHDLGMCVPPPTAKPRESWSEKDINQIRKNHGTAIHEIIKKEANDGLKQLYNFDPDLYWVIPHICAAHSTPFFKHEIELLRSEQIEIPRNFRADLLAMILLMADELDLTRHRVIINHPHITSLSPVSKAHWYKHYYISNVYIENGFINVIYHFPEEFPELGYFTEWVTVKLYEQMKTLMSLQNICDSNAFKFQINSRVFPDIAVKKAPPETIDVVKREVSKYQKKPPVKKQEFMKVIDFLQNSDELVQPKYIVNELNSFMNNYWRGLTEIVKEDQLRNVYVLCPANEILLNGAGRRLAKYVKDRMDSDLYGMERLKLWGSTPGMVDRDRKMEILAGGTGVGKTTFINYFLRVYMPEKYPEITDQYLWTIIECNGDILENEILYKITYNFLDRIKSSHSDLYAYLVENNFAPSEPSKIHSMGINKVKNILVSCGRRIIEENIQTHKELNAPKFFAFIIDNTDRLRSNEVRENILRIAYGLCRELDAFFLITLRESTIWELQNMNNTFLDSITEPTTNYVFLPAIIDVFRKRFEYAFRQDIVKHWWPDVEEEEVSLSAEWGDAKACIKFEDFKKSLESIFKMMLSEHKGQNFIVSLSRGNVRQALNIFHRVLRSPYLQASILLNLASETSAMPLHILIECIAKGNNRYYRSNWSILKNLFQCDLHGRYFVNIHLIDILTNLMKRYSKGPNDNYVPISRLINEAEAGGYSKEDVHRAIMFQISGELPTMELEHTDSFNSDIQRENDIKDDYKIRVSTVGTYMRNTVIKGFSYIQCIATDTPVPINIGERLVGAFDKNNISEIMEGVDEFLGFLYLQEIAESSILNETDFFNPSNNITTVIKKTVKTITSRISRKTFPYSAATMENDSIDEK